MPAPQIQGSENQKARTVAAMRLRMQRRAVKKVGWDKSTKRLALHRTGTAVHRSLPAGARRGHSRFENRGMTARVLGRLSESVPITNLEDLKKEYEERARTVAVKYTTRDGILGSKALEALYFKRNAQAKKTIPDRYNKMDDREWEEYTRDLKEFEQAITELDFRRLKPATIIYREIGKPLTGDLLKYLIDEMGDMPYYLHNARTEALKAIEGLPKVHQPERKKAVEGFVKDMDDVFKWLVEELKGLLKKVQIG